MKVNICAKNLIGRPSSQDPAASSATDDAVTVQTVPVPPTIGPHTNDVLSVGTFVVASAALAASLLGLLSGRRALRSMPRKDEARESGLSATSETSAAMREELQRMRRTFLALQSKLDERDQEIHRLRSGFEKTLFRRFLKRFIRAERCLTDRLRMGSAGPDSLRAVGALLEDALAESGVEKFDPEIGSDYRHAAGVADNPERVPTHDPNKAFRITSVLRSGYRFCEGAGDRTIVAAEVVVYEYVEPRRLGSSD